MRGRRWSGPEKVYRPVKPMHSPFKAYDIRGIYGAEIDDTLAFRVGRAFARFCGAVDMLGGYDARTHSGELLHAFAAGAASAGSRLHDAGCLSTPALHYVQMQRGYGAAVMATASHNPPQYHGFKLYDGSGGSVGYAKGLAEIEAAVAGDDQPLPVAVPSPPALPATAMQEYVAFATAHVRPEVAGMKVVIDISNGSAGALVQAAVDALGLDATLLNADPDGTFPAHPPNPLEEDSQRQVAEVVTRTGATLGALLDGDGDRILFFDERGELLRSCFAGALIAGSLLGQYPGAAIAYDPGLVARVPGGDRRRRRVAGQGAGRVQLSVRRDGAQRRRVRKRGLGTPLFSGARFLLHRVRHLRSRRAAQSDRRARPPTLGAGGAVARPLCTAGRDQHPPRPAATAGGVATGARGVRRWRAGGSGRGQREL